MQTIDGNWVMEGLSEQDESRIKNIEELKTLISDIGFLPLFKNHVKGFSVEERTASKAWWSGRPKEDPWQWREEIAAQKEIAYGKLFNGKAGFVSKEWYPLLAAYRRDGYDFDSRYEDGLASRRAKKLMDVLAEQISLPSNELKSQAGFCKGGEKGFEGAMMTLQMQTYITVLAFQRKKNKKNEEYGWPVAVYTLPEHLFGEEYIRSAYQINVKEAEDRILEHLMSKLSDVSVSEVKKCICL